MPLIRPQPFNMRDLNMQVRLETCVDGVFIDMTGKKSFNFGLWKDNVGFGITNIDIEVNPSLQPIIEITFKDLYGNTIFGTQREGGEIVEKTISKKLDNGDVVKQTVFAKPTEIDYSVLYNWPPPKFYFTFKGFLGSPVTWVLNLKKISTGFDSTDNSYEIKATFVPNQWGFFADLPFLYLLANKRLKKNDGLFVEAVEARIGNGNSRNTSAVNTIYDIIKIGRKVEVKKRETTKEFDLLLSQVSGLKGNAINTLYSSKIVKEDEVIDGTVNSRTIIDFDKFKLISPEFLKNEELRKSITTNPIKLDALNAFVISNGLVFGSESADSFKSVSELLNQNLDPIDLSFDALSVFNEAREKATKSLTDGGADARYFGSEDESLDAFGDFEKRYIDNDPNTRNRYKNKLDVLSENIRLIDQAIQQSFFETVEDQLEKLTISKVFSRMAGDAGYLMGKILQAGFDGESNPEPGEIPPEVPTTADGGVGAPAGFVGDYNRGSEEFEDTLIGLNYPMIIDGDGKEGPAVGLGIGVEKYEMKFVREFIQAVSEGIAENQAFQNQQFNGDENKLVKRVNNLEMLQENPYKPFYETVASNLILRSGIIGWMTRSFDPNRPGDFGNFTNFDNDDNGSIQRLADADGENISEFIILQMDDVELKNLKRFCTFWDNFLEIDGSVNPNADSENAVENPPEFTQDAEPAIGLSSALRNLQLSQGVPSSQLPSQVNFGSSALENYNVSIPADDGTVTTITLADFWSKDVLNAVKSTNPELLESGLFAEGGVSKAFFHNGVSFVWPQSLKGKTEPSGYYYVMFSNQDAIDAREVNSAGTDSEYQNQEEGSIDDPSGVWGQEEPLGVVPLDQYFDSEGDPLGRYSSSDGINGRIKFQQMFNYDIIKDPEFLSNASTLSEAGDLNSSSSNLDVREALWTEVFGDPDNLSSVTVDGVKFNEIAPERYSATIFGHSPNDGDITNFVFGLFQENQAGISQRVALKRMCSNLLQKIDKIETDKNKVIGDILGKAGEQEDVIYKQFHLLFNQWNVLAIDETKANEFSLFKDNGFLCNPVFEGRNLPVELERKYGGVQPNQSEFLELVKGFVGEGTGNKHLNVESPRDRDPNDEDTPDNDIFSKSFNKFLDTTGISSSEPLPDNVTFRYDYPLNNIRNANISVKDSLINIEPLYKPKANTTVLNMFQQICQKNNFMFIPIAGNGNYRSIEEIYTPNPNVAKLTIRNYFHVFFAPTPERRVQGNKNNRNPKSIDKETLLNFQTDALLVEFGGVDNSIISNMNVDTDDNKVTAESIVNLQRLVDNENRNKTVTTDCSMLPVLEGRSYKAKLEMLGNAQVYPMQYFYIDRSPLFGGLYQIMKVKHNISNNTMKTNVEGIKIVQTADGYGGVQPVTIDTLRNINVFSSSGGAFDDFLDDAGEFISNIFSSQPEPSTDSPAAGGLTNSTRTSVGSINNTNSTNIRGTTIAGETDVRGIWDQRYSAPRIKTMHPDFRPIVVQAINRVESQLGIRVRVSWLGGLRTIDDQNGLYAKGRTASDLTKVGINGITPEPNVKKVTTVVGGRSMHNYGVAFDITPVNVLVDGKRKSFLTGEVKLTNDYWQSIASVIKGLGLEWGGDWLGFSDKPHFQIPNNLISLDTLKTSVDNGNIITERIRSIDNGQTIDAKYPVLPRNVRQLLGVSN